MTTTHKKLTITLKLGAMAALVLGGAIQANAQDTVQMKKAVTTSTMSTMTVTQEEPMHMTVPPMETPDADMQAVLDTYKGMKPKAIEILNAKQARKEPPLSAAVMKLAKKEHIKMPGMKGIEHDDSAFWDAKGNKLDVDMYYTKAHGHAEMNRPVILYFHGGGWVIANRKVYMSSILALARKTGAIVVAPEYRQAPENRFPAAHEDAFSAYYWTLKNIKKFGGDPSHIAVVGESAGGNLAANVGMMARDNNLTMPVALGLIYPVAGTNMDTPSYKQNAFAMPLNKAMMGWFIANSVRPESRAEAMKDIRLDLVHANLNGLPPTTVITAGIDPLRSDGEKLAKKLEAAGVSTAYRNYSGVTHEFFGADAVVAKARDAQDYLAAQLSGPLSK